MSVYKNPRSPFWQYDFQIGSRRFHGSTKARTERDAEAVERVERERAMRGKEPPRPRRRIQKWIKRKDSDATTPLIGVYLLMLEGKIVYVGSSLDMPQRVAGHRSNGRPFERALYIATTAGEREALERILIHAIDPPQNWLGRDSRFGAGQCNAKPCEGSAP
jgi:hypothetical protein